MIERALALEDIRLLHVKVHPSETTKAKDLGFSGLITTATDFDAGLYADLILRADGFDQSFTGKVKGLLRQLRNQRPEETFEKLEVQGVNGESGRVEPINLLSDDLVRVVKIPRQSPRTRPLIARRPLQPFRGRTTR
jgi:hypothetical protein